MGKKKKNVKKAIVFDESDRVEFITGFKKRKDERRAKAKALIEEREREARRQARMERRQMVTNELQRLLIDEQAAHHAEGGEQEQEQAVEMDMGDQLVTIRPMDLNNLAGSLNCAMGSNRAEFMQLKEQDKKKEADHTSSSSSSRARLSQQKQSAKLMKKKPHKSGSRFELKKKRKAPGKKMRKKGSK